MTDNTHMAAVRAVLAELGLRERDPGRPLPASAHDSSLPVPCRGGGGRDFLLKYYLPPAPDQLTPVGVRLGDYARRETAFYRFLEAADPDRREVPVPRSVLIGPGDPPTWLLLEWIEPAPGPVPEVLGLDQVFEALGRLQAIPVDRLLGRRDFPLNQWTPVGYLERIRLMYEPALEVIGERRWRQVQKFATEAMRWTETRPPLLVHGDFTEQNLLVDQEGRGYLVDFEEIGIGNIDHDLAWLWIHSQRDQSWKRQLMLRWLGERLGSDRLRSEWGVRAALVYLAIRRLRWGWLRHGVADARASANIALMDAALSGGEHLFPLG